jgi:hypothetical protein
MVTMDTTISLGTILQTATLFAAIVVAFINLRERIVRIETKVDALWEQRHTERPS